jgi:XTP/dITP diphosphohydrolase
MMLILATHNKNKVSEIKAILGEKFDKIISAEEIGLTAQAEETGSTFYQNALLKAGDLLAQIKNNPKISGKIANYAVLSDDSGICVDALFGAPGVNSNRYFAEGDDKTNRTHLLEVLKDNTNRKAHFESCVVLLYPDGKVLSQNGITEGEILQEEKGSGGFGYDCIFYSYDLNKSFGEASPPEKNAVSHRARALNNLLNRL